MWSARRVSIEMTITFRCRGMRGAGAVIVGSPHTGRSAARPPSLARARKISSPIGRLDYARVQVADGVVEPLAVGGASVLSSTTRADGFGTIAFKVTGTTAAPKTDLASRFGKAVAVEAAKEGLGRLFGRKKK